MSKRALKKYLAELEKDSLEGQILELYERFPAVKQYYNFVFNPKEEKLIGEAKAKISNEYYPLKRKRPRARRSVAQKYIRLFQTLGVAPHLLADLMLFNLEIAQTFEGERRVPEAFYKSMLNSYSEAAAYIVHHGLLEEYKGRLITLYRLVEERDWPYMGGYSRALDLLE